MNKRLSGLDKAQLIALIKDLHDLTSGNRDFLQARYLDSDRQADALESYRRKVIEPFFPERGQPKLKLADARKAIREYQKASNSVAGTAELLLTYVEAGTQLTNTYGDIDNRFYNSLMSALNEFADLLLAERNVLYQQYKTRLEKLAHDTGSIGWGYGDYVSEIVTELELELDIEEEALVHPIGTQATALP